MELQNKKRVTTCRYLSQMVANGGEVPIVNVMVSRATDTWSYFQGALHGRRPSLV